MSSSHGKIAAPPKTKGDKVDPRSLPQIKDLAFNIRGHAFKYPDGFEDLPIYINARAESSTLYSSANATTKPRVAIPLTAKEAAAEPPHGLSQFLFVGWVIPQLPEQYFKRAGHIKNLMPVGVTRPPASAILVFDEDDETTWPLLAVVKVTNDDKHNSQLRSFALANQKHGVCTPYTVAQKEIFYMSEYRDNTTDLKTRPAHWNDIIRKHCIRTTNQPKTEESLRFQKTQDQSKLVLGPTTSLRNEILALIAGYSKSQDARFLSELRKVLKEIGQDPPLAPDTNSMLHDFLDVGKDGHDDEEDDNEDEDKDDDGGDDDDDDDAFGPDDAAVMQAELDKLWPEISPTPEQLLHVRRGIVYAQVAIDYRLLKPFLGEALYQLAKQQDALGGDEEVNFESKWLGSLVVGAYETVKRVIGTDPPVTINAKEEDILLKAIKGKLVEMVKIDTEFGQMLKDSTGDQAFDCTIQDIWNAYAHSCDTDAARTAFMDVVRLLVGAFRQKERYLARVAMSIVEILDKAGV